MEEGLSSIASPNPGQDVQISAFIENSGTGNPNSDVMQFCMLMEQIGKRGFHLCNLFLLWNGVFNLSLSNGCGH